MQKKNFGSVIVGLLLVLGLAFIARVEAQTSPVYWSGRAGGYAYRWTARDLTATSRPSGKVAYSVVAALKGEKGNRTPDAVEPEDHYEVSFFPLSVVGSLLSYERDYYWEGGAHPSGYESFATVDVRQPGKRVRITDLFPAEQVRRALLADGVVRRVLAREKVAPPPTLDGLVKALANKQFGGDDDDMYVFPSILLEAFAFHHIENGKVAVRFLLPNGTEIYRFRHTQLGILLPIPARLKPAFTDAATGKGGALMQSLQRMTKGRSSSLVLVE
ncbi:MAG: hypothetical protein H7145_03010 [Akkermansiaceae bacterium]|nr:hypothetical protein [Armatimonadota bacterium]